jgi:hypothetical protein
MHFIILWTIMQSYYFVYWCIFFLISALAMVVPYMTLNNECLLVPYRRRLCQYGKQFCALFWSVLSDIRLIFVTLLCHTVWLIKFEFGFDPLIFHYVMAHGLRKISWIVSCPHALFVRAFRYAFGIWNIALLYQVSGQVRIWYWSFEFSRSYCPWPKKNNHKLLSYSFDIWYVLPSYLSSLDLVIIHWFFTKLWPLDLEISFLPIFSPLLALLSQWARLISFVVLELFSTGLYRL